MIEWKRRTKSRRICRSYIHKSQDKADLMVEYVKITLLYDAYKLYHKMTEITIHQFTRDIQLHVDKQFMSDPDDKSKKVTLYKLKD